MGGFRKETHAHRGRCAGSRTARDSAPQSPFGTKLYYKTYNNSEMFKN